LFLLRVRWLRHQGQELLQREQGLRLREQELRLREQELLRLVRQQLAL
jgi:hypothetical protein